MKIVLDTNILVSGTFWIGASSKILELIDEGTLKIVLSKELINEYYEVINREEIMDKIVNKNLILNKSVTKIIKEATIVGPLEKSEVIVEDPDDNKILDYAFEGKADYILSYDNHLLKLKEFQAIKILTPEQFLETFEQK